MNLDKLKKGLMKGPDKHNQREIDRVVQGHQMAIKYKLKFKNMFTRMQAKQASKLGIN